MARPLESLVRSFVDLHPEDAAGSFEALDASDRARVFKTLPTRIALSLAERISPHILAPLISKLPSEKASELLMSLPPRVASGILHHIEPEDSEQLLAALPAPAARALQELARYPADTAGGIMEPRVVSLSSGLTVQQAITAIRKAPRDALHYLYVTERDGVLAGVINMRDLLLASPREPIKPLINTRVLSVRDTMNSEEVVDLMRERGFLALPVLDFEGRLVGVVQHAEALQAGQENAFEDLQRIVGAGADERALSPVPFVVRSRLPWLYVNLLTAFMASAVVGIFEATIAKVAALAVLLPVVAGQGGNTGSQSLAVVMRGLALREVVPGVKRRLIMKEFTAGLINGVAVAVVTSAAVFAWRMTAGDPLSVGAGLALVIGLAMIVNMAAAAIAGAVIPLALQVLGRDPAQSAAIFLTTVTDIVGFAAFLGFAAAMMPLIT